MRVTAIPDAGKESLVKQIKDALQTSRSNATYVTGPGFEITKITKKFNRARFSELTYNFDVLFEASLRNFLGKVVKMTIFDVSSEFWL